MLPPLFLMVEVVAELAKGSSIDATYSSYSSLSGDIFLKNKLWLLDYTPSYGYFAFLSPLPL